MTTVSRRRSLEQERAAKAWDCVRSVTGRKKEYVSLARGAPADIQANGLGQTLAFWKAKKEPEHRQVYAAVSQWIQERLNLGDRDLLEWVIKDANTNDYRRATAEAMAFLTWLKRFAEAELESGDKVMSMQRRDRDQRRPPARDRQPQADKPADKPMYPLPNATVAAWRAYQNKCPQNPGLIFHRFAPDWGREPRGERNPWKKRGLEEVIRATRLADSGLLAAWNSRWQEAARAVKAEPFPLKTDWRLIAGLGRKGPLEVGFTFHRYGLPILPGSSLKGIARTWGLITIAAALDASDLNWLDKLLSEEDNVKFKKSLEQREPSKGAKLLAQDFRTIFGTTANAGGAVFLDAIPSQKPALDLDIMNPHYPDYYRDAEGKVAPADWQSPIPVYFLTVAPSKEFRFAVGWRGPREEGWERLRDQAKGWLISGLTELGAGAKTSAGYGYFEPLAEPSDTRPVAAAPTAPPAEPEPELIWRCGTVREYQPNPGRGRLVDDETKEELRFTRDAIEDKGWSPGRRAKVMYAMPAEGDRTRVVRLRRQT